MLEDSLISDDEDATPMPLHIKLSNPVSIAQSGQRIIANPSNTFFPPISKNQSAQKPNKPGIFKSPET